MPIFRNSSTFKTHLLRGFWICISLAVFALALQAQAKWDHIDVLSSVGGICHDLTLRDSQTICGEGSSVSILSMKNLSTPQLIDKIHLPWVVGAVRVAGDFAYVVSWNDKHFRIIDLSRPYAPRLRGALELPEAALKLTVAGPLCLVVCGDAGVRAVDISNPDAPTLRGLVNTPGTAHDAVINANYAYVADFKAGLQICDISDPAAPKIAGSCALPGKAWSVAVAGPWAYVADGSKGGLQIVDISDPQNPKPVQSMDTPGAAYGVALTGQYAFVADGESGVQVIDIANPTQPRLVGSCETSDTAYAISVQGTLGCVNSRTSVQLIDLSDPLKPQPRGSYATPGALTAADASPSQVCALDMMSGVQMLDLSDPCRPFIKSEYDITQPGIINTEGGLAITTSSNAIQLYQSSTGGVPQLTSTINVSGTLLGAHLDRQRIYYIDNPASATLHILDIAQPQSPVFLGSCFTGNPGSWWSKLTVAGDMAYYITLNQVGSNQGVTLFVFNCADPAHPFVQKTEFHNEPEVSYNIDIAVSGTILCAAYLSHIDRYDLTSEDGPNLTSSVTTDGLRHIVLSGSYLFAIIYDEVQGYGIQAFDVTDPNEIVPLGYCPLPFSYALAVRDPYIFAIDGLGEMTIMADRDRMRNSVKTEWWLY